MKKLYTTLFLIAGLLTAIPVHLFAQSTTGKVHVGYAKYDDQIYEYDGLSLEYNSKVGCAILLTRDMLEPYIGGTIKSMRVGWDDRSAKGNYDCFVRKDFNGEDLSTGTKAVSFGWNTVTMEDYEIPEDVDQLVVGFTAQLKKNVCSIPLLYPQYTRNSCYLWVDGDFDGEGKPQWVDMNAKGRLPILLTIQDTKGTFNFVPVISSLVDDGVYIANKASDCLLRIWNRGSQAIKKVEITSRQGEDVYSKNVSLSTSITTSSTSKPILMPLYAFRSGEVEVSITKVNDKEIPAPPTATVNVIVVPQDVADAYSHRPLVEYFESENNYMSSRYFDEIVSQNIRGIEDRITYVSQHMDDQFMTGDDDATTLMVQLCSNDSSLAEVPSMSIDRSMSTDNISYQQNTSTTPKFSVLYEPYGSKAMKAAMSHPTFLNITASGLLKDDMETVDVSIGGEIAAGILPEGEQPRLTVYLMERNVISDSQMFWSDKEKEAHEGEYTHANVIREILSSAEGDAINAAGAIDTTFTTQIDPSWNLENLYLVAFVHRDGKLGGRRMQVFNSTEGDIDISVAVRDIQDNEGTAMASGKQTIFDLSGRRVQPGQLQHGLYIVNGKKVVR